MKKNKRLTNIFFNNIQSLLHKILQIYPYIKYSKRRKIDPDIFISRSITFEIKIRGWKEIFHERISSRVRATNYILAWTWKKSLFKIRSFEIDERSSYPKKKKKKKKHARLMTGIANILISIHAVSSTDRFPRTAKWKTASGLIIAALITPTLSGAKSKHASNQRPAFSNRDNKAKQIETNAAH